MKKLALIIGLVLCSLPLVGQTCNAPSASSSNVQTALIACAAGGTVNIPPGSATWTTQVSVAVTGPVTIQGATTCTAGCSAGSQGVSLAFTDNTSITMSVSGNPALVLNGCSATNLCRITNLTMTNTTSNSAIAGAVQINGTHGQVSYRFDHNHVTNTGSSAVFLFTQEGYGLRDHILYSGTNDYSFSSSGGDFPSGGYLNWQDATNPGTNQADITEDSNFTFNSANDMVTDGYFGCKITIRYNQISGGQAAGFTHGTDSGGYRSCALAEIYNNTMSLTANQSPWESRGGTTLFHDNVLTGSFQFNSIGLAYFRATTDAYSVTSGWGLAAGGGNATHPATSGLNWVPQTQGGSTMTLNASAYQTSHVYTAGAVATLSSGGPCNVQIVVGGTSGGTAPICPAFGATVTDGGGVISINVGGTTAAGPGGDGFLNTDNETTCISGVTCTRFLDDSSGYPLRDQPCVVHGQVVYGCYQWNNTGSQVPASWWSADPSTAIQLNRDYFSSAPSGYSTFSYPDPLQGAPSGGAAAGFQTIPIATATRTAAQGQVLVCKP